MKRLVFVLIMFVAISAASAQAPRSMITLGWDALDGAVAYDVCYGQSEAEVLAGETCVRVTEPSAVLYELDGCEPYLAGVYGIDADGYRSTEISDLITGWPAPIIDSIEWTPAGAVPGGSRATGIIRGVNFRNVEVKFPDSPFVTTVAVLQPPENCTRIDVTVEVAADATAGDYLVRVRDLGDCLPDGTCVAGDFPGGIPIVARVPLGKVENVGRGDRR